MNSDTMDLCVVTPDRRVGVVVDEFPQRRWFTAGTRINRRHRVRDYIRRLKEELKISRKLSDDLTIVLNRQIIENVELKKQLTAMSDRVATLEADLETAREANTANDRYVDFIFSTRPIDGIVDEPTMPVPRIDLLAEVKAKESAIDAATMLLDRVASQIHTVEVSSGTIQTRDNVVEGSCGNDEDEVYNTTRSAWHSRVTPISPNTSWRYREPLKTSRSSTGTFSVVALHQRGDGPSAVPSSLP